MFVVDGVDLETESEGIWTDFLGARFKIASSSNLAYQKKMARLYRPHRKAFEKGKIDPEVSRQIVCKGIVGTILTDWEEVCTADGETFEFNEENAYTALESNEDLREFILEFADDISNYRAELVDETVKA